MSRDKRITAHQALLALHEFYDGLESCSLVALEKALHDVLGVGSKRFERVKAVYLEILGEEAQKRAESFKKQTMRRIGK